jgi:hypothetical protein
MQRQAEPTIQLLDAEQRPLGQVTIERCEDRLLFGKFVPGPAFPAVEHLFRAFEEAVNAQALSVVEELDAAIAALGLHFRWPEDSQAVAIHDVQIWSDGEMTCRLSGHALAEKNGRLECTPLAQPVRE